MQTETGSKWLCLPVTRLEGERPANFRGEVKEKLRYAFFVEAPANQPGVDGSVQNWASRPKKQGG